MFAGAAAIAERLYARLRARYLAAEGALILVGENGWRELAACPTRSLASLYVSRAASASQSLEELLVACARAVEPRGRIVLDLPSGDHAASGVRAADLVALLDEVELQANALVPFGAICEQIGEARWLSGSMAGGLVWDRVLSWAAVHEDFFAFLAFVDGEVVGALPTCASGRFLAVIDNAPAPAANAALAARNRDFNDALRRGFAAATVEPFVGACWAAWRSRLSAFLDERRNVIAGVRLLDACRRAGYPIALNELLEERHHATIAMFMHRLAIDDACMDLIDRFERHPALSEILAPAPGMRPGFGWDLLPDLLRAALGLK